MRSIWSTGNCSYAVVPVVAEPTRMPSISTSVSSASVPRTKTEVALPRPPVFAIEIPARPVSSSATECGCSLSISSRVMTVTDARVWSAGSAMRVAVTTIGSRSRSDAEQTTGPMLASASTPAMLVLKTLSLSARPARSVGVSQMGSQGETEQVQGSRRSALAIRHMIRHRPPRATDPASGRSTDSRADFHPGTAPSRAFAQWYIAIPSNAPTVAGAVPAFRLPV